MYGQIVLVTFLAQKSYIMAGSFDILVLIFFGIFFASFHVIQWFHDIANIEKERLSDSFLKGASSSLIPQGARLAFCEYYECFLGMRAKLLSIAEHG